MLKKIFLPGLFITLSAWSVHAQLVFSGGAKMNINGGVSGTPTIVVLDPTGVATPITTSGATDGIISEKEYNQLQYNLSTGTTAITVPFLRNSDNSACGISVTGITAGTGSGNIRFSNHSPLTVGLTTATGWNNVSFMPSIVTHMSQNTAPGTNGSDYAVDRFWVIDANGYTTKPAVTLGFTYIDDEYAANTNAGSNSITEANLGAQRFNTTSSIWGDFSPVGTVTAAANTVTGVTVTAANFFAAWTLSDKTNPLPVELSALNAHCINDKAVISWTTASEINSSYFLIQKSLDGISFDDIASVTAAGNSNSIKNYSFTDFSSSEKAYYRLKQVDLNGQFRLSNVMLAECGTVPLFEFINALNCSEHKICLTYSSDKDLKSYVRIYNSLGQIVYDEAILLSIGYNQRSLDNINLSSGIYYVGLSNQKENIVRKVFVE